MDTTVDLLVISIACHTAINRSVYKLFEKTGMSVVLVVPTEFRFSTGSVKADLHATDDPTIIFLDLLGSNSRVSRFGGIFEILNRYHPKLIVLDNDPISITALQIGIWSRIAGSKLFCISCENMSLGILSSFRRRGIRSIPQAIFKKMLLLITRRLVYGVFTINNEGTDIFRNEGFRNVMRIPLGFDPKYFCIDPSARELIRSKLNLKGFVIGFFGRVSFEKGVHVLISALENLSEYKWTLLIDEFDTYKNKYGEEILRRLSNSNLLDHVVFINPKHIEMGEYINSVDVVVMPSISTKVWIEQYGRVAAEAMACGKLVVASDSGALPMLLNGYGLLFQEGNVDALAEILKNIISMGSNSAGSYSPEEISQYARNMLSIDRQMEQMCVFFDETLHDHSNDI
jgi:glycosyltransferase involved in cell wall biosynthesis